MSVKTFEAKDYIEAVTSSFREDSDLVVVKNVLSPGAAECLASLAPDLGKQRVYLRPLQMVKMYDAVPVITSSREQIKEVLNRQFGQTALRRMWLQIPDMIRASHVGAHVDHGAILFSTAINLRGNVDFYGKRIAACNESAKDISRSYEEWRKEKILGEPVTLEVGDAAIISRGVLHATQSSPGRRAITYRSRGFVKS